MIEIAIVVRPDISGCTTPISSRTNDKLSCSRRTAWRSDPAARTKAGTARNGIGFTKCRSS
jgi:hypothetical protein